MYKTADGGRKGPAFAGWACPCMASKMEPLFGYEGIPLIGDLPLLPGQNRKLGFFFPSFEDAVPLLRIAKRFYLWEGGFVGEAVIIGDG